MAYDQYMQSYLGIGTLASRPTTLNIKPGVAAFYYAVDVGELCIWDAGTWYTLATGSTTLAGDSDVAIATPTDGQVLTYVGAASKWENRTPLAGGGSTVERLAYIPTTDFANGIAMTANTWTDFCANQSFTVGSSGSLATISAGGFCRFTGTIQNITMRLVIDSASTPLTRRLGGCYQTQNGFAGSVPQLFTGLSAGVHTVKVQIMNDVSGGTFYCRPASFPDQESFSLFVVEQT